MKRSNIVIALLAVFVLTGQVSTQTVPIYEGTVRGIVGGARKGRWVRPVAAGPGKKYRMVTLEGVSGEIATGTDIGTRMCNGFRAVELDPLMSGGVAVGTAAKWKLMPRKLKPVAADDVALGRAISGYLKARKFKVADVRVKQAYRIDLDGDGREEVVFAATRYTGKPSNLNEADPFNAVAQFDYSFIGVVRTIAGRARLYLLNGEFYPKPQTDPYPDYSRMIYEISAIADLNGDGKMEVVIDFWTEGEAGADIYELKAGRPLRVKGLGASCSSA